MNKREKDNLDTCKNNPEQFTGFAVSKLNKKISLKLLSNIGLIFGIILFGSFQPAGIKTYGLTKVVIDAGHGGHDPGSLGKKTKEKDVALGISLKLGKYIEDHFSDVKVIYTRKTDEFVELYERAEIANNAKADLFICIHCNSACFFDKKKKKEVCNRQIEGVESWVMGLNKSEANLEVSKRENEVILLEKDYTSQYDGFDPNSPEANIIFSLYQNTYLEQSLRMATLVQQEVKSSGRPGRGVKQAGFLVLFKTFMPSILIETGFLSNENEEKYLASAKGQDEIASLIFNAFKQYKSSVESGKMQEEPGKNDKPEEKPKANDNSAEKQNDSVKKTEVKPVENPEEKAPQKADINATAPVKPALDSAKSIVKSDESVKPKEESKSDSDLLYSVQFLTASKAIPDNNKAYKDFKDVREDYDGGIYKYSTGTLKTKEEAIKLQSEIRSLGYKDAFVIAFYNNKRVSIKEAEQIGLKKTR